MADELTIALSVLTGFFFFAVALYFLFVKSNQHTGNKSDEDSVKNEVLKPEQTKSTASKGNKSIPTKKNPNKLFFKGQWNKSSVFDSFFERSHWTNFG